VNFLGSEAVERDRLGELWDEVVLEPEEEGVTEALRIIDPRIERIAFIGDSPRASRNIFLKLADSEQRLPLGSMGDGLKRLLSLALHLFSARGGFLLVDEIDTGLHHTVMVNMWKLVIQTARRLDVQVLATSHSLDCVRALAWVREQNPDLASDVTLHRVEKGATTTVAFTSDELLVAAQNHLELR
jgi:predicted ATPase